MILILLAFMTLNLEKTEFVDTIETSDYGTYAVVTSEYWYGKIEWDATQGDTLITSAIPLGIFDDYKLYLDGIAYMAIGWYVENNMPMNNWAVITANTNSTNKAFRVVHPWNKWDAYLGFVARTTELRTVRILIAKHRI